MIKPLITTLLLTLCLSGGAQTISWTKCIEEPSYTEILGDGNPKTIHKTARFCYNSGAFAYNDGYIIRAFPIIGYQETTISGVYVEQFYSGAADGHEEMELSVTIHHGHPVTITIQKPAQPNAWAHIMETKQLPSISATKQTTDTSALTKAGIGYKKPVYDKRIKYPATNNSLNPGLKCEAICPVDLKKYLKTKMPYLNSTFNTIMLMLDVSPDGKITNAAAGIGLDADKQAKKFFKDLQNVMKHMPLWKVPENTYKTIHANMDINY